MQERVTHLLRSLDQLEAEVSSGLRKLTERVEGSERSVRIMAEEMDERIDRGNKIWRRIRSKEHAEAERAALEGEPEPDENLPLFNGEGSDSQGLRPMYGDLAAPGERLQPHQVVARQIAASIAGRA